MLLLGQFHAKNPYFNMGLTLPPPPPLNNVKFAELVRDGFHYLPSFQASNGIRLLKIGDNVEMWGQGVVRSADILSKMC